MTVILGIDPGTERTGYGVVEFRNRRFRLVECGLIRLPRGKGMPERLGRLYEGLEKLLQELKPDEVAVEDSFYSRNVKSALKLGQARGVALLAAHRSGRPVAEYPPAQVKLTVTGYGRADKKQVAYMVSRLLREDLENAAEDATDALAVAICHGTGLRLRPGGQAG